MEISLRAEFTALDDRLEEANLNNVPEKLISISKKIANDQPRSSESHRKAGYLPLFDRKVIILNKHINYVNQIREKLKSGYQHLVSIETELLKKLENDTLKKSETKISSKENESKISEDKKNELLVNLINLDEKDFIIYLKKIFGEEISLLDWKRILCIYLVFKQKMFNESGPIKTILSKDAQLELKNIYLFFQHLEAKNKSKLFTIRNLISKALINELDEVKYPTVNYVTKSNPNKLLIFISGGISFNELNLVKTNLDTILISDAILYPRKFLNALKS